MTRKNDPFLYTAYTMFDKGFLDIEGDVLITDENGEIQKIKVGAKEKAIYAYLLGRISVYEFEKEGEYLVNPSYSRIGKAMGGMDRETVRKAVYNLKAMGMIDFTATDGKQHEYEMFKMLQSRIMYDRKKPNGKYYHEEIKWYIEKFAEQKNNPTAFATPGKVKTKTKGQASEKRKRDLPNIVKHGQPGDRNISPEEILKDYPMLSAST